MYLPGPAFQRRPLLETSTTRSSGKVHPPSRPHPSRQIHRFQALLGKLPEEITTGVTEDVRVIWGDTLRSTDIGMRFSSDALTVRDLYGSYPIVRWRDRWNTWWEYKHGEVRETTESEPWKP